MREGGGNCASAHERQQHQFKWHLSTIEELIHLGTLVVLVVVVPAVELDLYRVNAPLLVRRAAGIDIRPSRVIRIKGGPAWACSVQPHF